MLSLFFNTASRTDSQNEILLDKLAILTLNKRSKQIQIGE
ncbi:hypothetical protein [Vibrio vulnificus YJ016]|uniref:Uncharacterized protein n=1 Tax=Vibrio vulnificus (strain YJ016) TaxID=196600 RepID=Q7MEA5_VIBVY|nr:hypothetical protein [Vibrio vulnificus YJ016]